MLVISLLYTLLLNITPSSNASRPAQEAVLDSELNFGIGTRWVYERENPISDGIAQVNFEVYEITDTATIGGRSAFLLARNGQADFNRNYLYTDGQQVYFWDHVMEDFQLQYDFEEADRYDTPWIGQCDSSDEGVATVHIDSLGVRPLPQGQEVGLQYLRIANNGTYQDQDLNTLVYRGIGQAAFGPKLLLGYGLCDPVGATTVLRCFEHSNGESYNFVGYPCDSVFVRFTSSREAERLPFKVYPNPIATADGTQLTVELPQPLPLAGLRGARLQVYSSVGQLLHEQPLMGRRTVVKLPGRVPPGHLLLRIVDEQGALVHAQLLAVF